MTCFTSGDLYILQNILKQPLEKTLRGGLHPTPDQIELFGYNLPNHNLSDLLKIFISICKVDDGQYFLCNFDDIISLAEMIDHIPIKLKTKYTFATAPINLKQGKKLIYAYLLHTNTRKNLKMKIYQKELEVDLPERIIGRSTKNNYR